MREYREAKYLVDLEAYTTRQIDIIYGNPKRRVSSSELINLVSRAETLEDYETVQAVMEKYGFDIPEEEQDAKTEDLSSIDMNEVDAMFDSIRGMLYAPLPGEEDKK